MGSRLLLHNILISLLGTGNVYFQPPPSFQMSYPCIVYERSNIDTAFANNEPYKHEKRYTVTVIDSDPDSLIPDKVAELSRCSFDRNFKADQLNHDVFRLIY
jgi:hypothetical protein